MSLRRLTAPASRLVELSTAKAHLVVEHDDDDVLIGGFIAAFESHVDGSGGVLGRALVEQSWALDLPGFPCRRLLRLPLPPLISVESVGYFEPSGAAALLAEESYRVLPGESGGLELVEGAAWPSTACRTRAVTVSFTAGYGPDVADVPQRLVQACLLTIGHWYRNREAMAEDAGTELPLGVRMLLAPLKVRRV